MAHRGAGLVWRTSRRWATPGRPAQRATRGMLVGRVVAVPPSCGMADGTAGCVPPCSGARAVSTYRQAHDGGASAGAGRDAGANPQAAGLVIGDEILTGKTSDKNVPFLGASLCGCRRGWCAVQRRPADVVLAVLQGAPSWRLTHPCHARAFGLVSAPRTPARLHSQVHVRTRHRPALCGDGARRHAGTLCFSWEGRAVAGGVVV